MKKRVMTVMIVLVFVVPLVALFSLEYLSIWNEWSLFIPNDDKMRSWVDKNEVVNLFKEKYPDSTETILPYSGTRHYWLENENSNLRVDLNNDGDIKYIEISCLNSNYTMCWSSQTNYLCVYEHGNSTNDQMLEYLKSDSCK